MFSLVHPSTSADSFRQLYSAKETVLFAVILKKESFNIFLSILWCSWISSFAIADGFEEFQCQ
jgi:hypothetical protein